MPAGGQVTFLGNYTSFGSKFTGITYTQSTVYPSNAAADETSMNNGSANESVSTKTGVNIASGSWLKANLGSSKFVSYIQIGYDYLNNLPGGWGTGYTQGLLVETSPDDSTWTPVKKTPAYSAIGTNNGLVNVPINRQCQYVRMSVVGTNYMCATEFSLWGI